MTTKVPTPKVVEDPDDSTIDLTRFAEVSAALQEKLRETLQVVKTTATPDSIFAAMQTFEDPDMLAYLRRDLARYEMALAGIDASVRDWRAQRRCLDEKVATSLVEAGAPLGELSESLNSGWGEIKSLFQDAPKQTEVFEPLDEQLDTLVDCLRLAA